MFKILFSFNLILTSHAFANCKTVKKAFRGVESQQVQNMVDLMGLKDGETLEFVGKNCTAKVSYNQNEQTIEFRGEAGGTSVYGELRPIDFSKYLDRNYYVTSSQSTYSCPPEEESFEVDVWATGHVVLGGSSIFKLGVVKNNGVLRNIYASELHSAMGAGSVSTSERFDCYKK